MQNLNETLKQLDQLQYNYGKVGNTMTKEEYKAEFKRIAEMTTKTQNKVNSRVKEYEGYLASYIAQGAECLEGLDYRFSGDYWLNVNRPSIESANLDPYALKEAYLKACDFYGVERPATNQSVEESSARVDEPFWETGVNPITGHKEEALCNVVVPEETVTDYNYQF